MSHDLVFPPRLHIIPMQTFAQVPVAFGSSFENTDSDCTFDLVGYAWIRYELIPFEWARKLPLEQPAHVSKNTNIPEVLRLDLHLNVDQSVLRFTDQIKLSVSFRVGKSKEELVIMTGQFHPKPFQSCPAPLGLNVDNMELLCLGCDFLHHLFDSVSVDNFTELCVFLEGIQRRVQLLRIANFLAQNGTQERITQLFLVHDVLEDNILSGTSVLSGKRRNSCRA